MRDLSRCPLLLMLTALLLAGLLAVPAARADLVINEILGDPDRDWDGDGEVSYRGDEWVEIFNAGGVTESLSEYWLRDGYGITPHIRLEGELAAGEVLVVYGSDAVTWQQLNDQPIVGLSINNTGDSMELLRTDPDGGGDDLLVVQRVTVRDHEVENDRSSGRDHESGWWVLYDALNPYPGTTEPTGTDCEPTPGEPNVCTTNVAVEGRSWDAVKSRYRLP